MKLRLRVAAQAAACAVLLVTVSSAARAQEKPDGEAADSEAARDSIGRLQQETECGPREVVEVHDVAGLRAQIARDHVDVRMAPGQYVLPACPAGADEWSSTDCGQLRQGACSILSSDLRLATDDEGVPASSGLKIPGCASIPTGGPDQGAVIDCGQLSPSDLELSCLVAGDRSTIRNLTVCNGPPPVHLSAGQSGVHRNGIMILADHPAVVDSVRVVNARRGGIMTGISGRETRGTMSHSLVEDTELAGIFVWARQPDGQGTNDARLTAEVVGNHIVRPGLHPLIAVYAFGGYGNQVRASFVDNVVEVGSVLGVTIQGVGVSAEGNQAWFEVQGGRLSGGRGVYVAGLGSGISNNDVRGKVSHVTMGNGVPALGVEFEGTGNGINLGFTDNRYVGATPGLVQVILGAGNDFVLDGSPRELGMRNDNFDFTQALPYLGE